MDQKQRVWLYLWQSGKQELVQRIVLFFKDAVSKSCTTSLSRN